VSDYFDLLRAAVAGPDAFQARPSAASTGRFRAADEPLAWCDGINSRGTIRNITLAGGPVSWLRLTPRQDPGRTWTVEEIAEAVTAEDFVLAPYGLGRGAYEIGLARGADGYGAWVASGRDYQTLWTSYVFDTGEIWGIDALSLNRDHGLIHFDAAMMAATVDGWRALLRRMGAEGPWRWMAGLEETSGRRLAPDSDATLFQPEGRAEDAEITAEGEISDEDPGTVVSSDFLAAIREACGLEP
jgi:hypothetical protein